MRPIHSLPVGSSVMKRQARFIATGLVAVAMCSCSAQAELERAKATAEAARLEAEQARAAAEAARSEALAVRAKLEADEKAKADAAKAKDAEDKAMAEVMNRWNAATSGATATPPNFGQVNFKWDELDKFPHPTYKGGSAEAYGAFAEALALFLQKDDNFDYLAKNNLFNSEVRYAFPSGQHSTWTFAKLADQLSQPTGYGAHKEATRKVLRERADKMKKTPKE